MKAVVAALLISLSLTACAPNFQLKAPPAPPVEFHVAHTKIDDDAATPAYPVAGPFAHWLPVQRDAARQLHEAIVDALPRQIQAVGGAGTVVLHLTYVDVSIHKNVVDHPPFIIDDDRSPRPVRTTVLGSLRIEDNHGAARRTAPVDIHELVMHRLNSDDAVRDAVRQASRLALADLYRQLEQFSGTR